MHAQGLYLELPEWKTGIGLSPEFRSVDDRADETDEEDAGSPGVVPERVGSREVLANATLGVTGSACLSNYRVASRLIHDRC